MKRRAFIGAAGGLLIGVAGNLALRKAGELYSISSFPGRYDGTDENLDKILKRAESDALYVFLGEKHTDSTLHSRVLMPLIESGTFSSIYLEALKRGDYRQEGEALRNRSVFKWNPEKYDRIIEASLKHGLNVHGIDAHDEREDGRVRNWAQYIIGDKRDGSSLVLTGRGHVNFWREHQRNRDPSDILPAHMAEEGVKPGRLLTVTTLFHSDISQGLYRVYELPDVGGEGYNTARVFKENRAADFVWCRN
jgi:hypothetical protein